MAVTEDFDKFFEQFDLSLANINLAEAAHNMSTTSGDLYESLPTVVINGASGTISNPIWTTSATGNIYANAIPSWNINPGTSTSPWYTTGTNTDQSGKLILQGENADLDINGKSLKTWMQKVEERLNILTPNPELEKEWDELRRLGERYRKLEKKCQQKSDMWNRLKSLPKSDC